MPTDYTVIPMTQHIRQRRGTTTAINSYAGVIGELVVDTTKNAVVVVTGTAGVNQTMAKESLTITSGSGITLKKNGSVASSVNLSDNFSIESDTSALVAANDLLTTDANGKLKGAFSLSYDPTTGKFAVLGSDSTTELAYVTVPSHLSALSVAEMVTASTAAPVDGNTSGTFLHFRFTLSNSSTSDMYINVTDLIDIYTAGDGLTVSNNAFSVVPTNGIVVSAQGVGVKLLSTETILKFDSNGNLYVDTDAVKTATDQIIVSADSANVIQTGSDGGALLKVAASANALVVNDAGELIVPLDAGVIAEPSGD